LGKTRQYQQIECHEKNHIRFNGLPNQAASQAALFGGNVTSPLSQNPQFLAGLF
jgi:hypothetical protein